MCRPSLSERFFFSFFLVGRQGEATKESLPKDARSWWAKLVGPNASGLWLVLVKGLDSGLPFRSQGRGPEMCGASMASPTFQPGGVRSLSKHLGW